MASKDLEPARNGKSSSSSTDSNEFSSANDTRVNLTDYASTLHSLAHLQPMALNFLVKPTAPPTHKTKDADSDPVWPQKTANSHLKFALDELNDGRLAPSPYTYEHHRVASLGLPAKIAEGIERSFVFDDGRMSAVFLCPVDSNGKPARDEFRGLFYPTRLCQGPLDNCHGGSTFTFLNEIATVLAGLWLEGNAGHRGKLPYLSTKSHENTYKDGVPIGTISGFRTRVASVSHDGDATTLEIHGRIYQRMDPTGLSPKFAVESKTLIRIPFSGRSQTPVPYSLPPLEEAVLARLVARQPELGYMPRSHLGILAPLLRSSTHRPLVLPERTDRFNRTERFHREADPASRRIYGLYFYGKPQGPPGPGEENLGDLRPGVDIVGLAYFHPQRAGAGSGIISHGAIAAHIDSGFGMLQNTALLASVPKGPDGKRANLGTHQWNFRTLLLELKYNGEARHDDAAAGLVMFRVWVKRVEKGGRKTIFGGAIYSIPSGSAASADRPKFISDDLVPLVESESLFVDASHKYGGKSIAGVLASGEKEKKVEEDDGFETPKL